MEWPPTGKLVTLPRATGLARPCLSGRGWGGAGRAGAGISLLQVLCTKVTPLPPIHLGSQKLRKLPGMSWKPPTALHTDTDKSWARYRGLGKGGHNGLASSHSTGTPLAKPFPRTGSSNVPAWDRDHSLLGPQHGQSTGGALGRGLGRDWPSCISTWDCGGSQNCVPRPWGHFPLPRG